MEFSEFLFLALTVNLALNGVIWLVSLVKRNVTVVDPFWGLGFAIMASALYLVSPGAPFRSTLVLAMSWIWGLRYALHLYWRQWGHTEETTYYPYLQWRRQAGRHFWLISVFKIFLPQAFGITLIGLPIIIAMYSDVPADPTVLDAVGVAIWLAGMSIEAIADYQLAVFKHDSANRGKVLSRGLWRYSRHPNYFGDALMWWGFCCVAWSTPASFIAIVSPVTMTLLLMLGSGVTLVEQRSAVATNPKYASYIRRTSAFFPLPPKRRSRSGETAAAAKTE